MKMNLEVFRISEMSPEELFPISGGSINTTRSGTAVTRSSGADGDNNGSDYDI